MTAYKFLTASLFLVSLSYSFPLVSPLPDLTVAPALAQTAAKGEDKKEAASKPSDNPDFKVGPARLSLGDKLAEIDLPQDFGLVSKSKTEEFCKAEGNSTEGVLGMIVPKFAKEEKAPPYFVMCRFEDIGYVKDDDAGKLDAAELLKAFKEGNKEANEDRKREGITPFYVGDWSELPHYDKAKHQVVWGIEVKDEDAANAPVSAVNYNTRILGRRGVLSMNLVSDPATLEKNKKEVAKLLDRTTFVKGASYADYQPGKDKDSGLGITGLILGGGALAAAAKFGVLGGLWKWAIGLLLVGKKFIILIVVGIGALIAKIFKKKDGGASGT